MKGLILVVVFAALAGAGVWYFTQPATVDPAIADIAARQASAAFAETSQSAPVSATLQPIGVPTQQQEAGEAMGGTMTPKVENKKYMQATLHTNQGDITIEFDSAATPNTVANFTKLAGSGFYDGVKFHRVIKGFMIQGGDPLSKDDSMQDRWGTGGPGYSFNDEIGPKNHNGVGTISMANAGPNTNGSQFFINVAENSFLDPKHTVFGKVVAGMDVVSAIENTPTGAADRPLEPMVIKSISLQ